jgi:hypothetical protein
MPHEFKIVLTLRHRQVLTEQQTVGAAAKVCFGERHLNRRQRRRKDVIAQDDLDKCVYDKANDETDYRPDRGAKATHPDRADNRAGQGTQIFADLVREFAQGVVPTSNGTMQATDPSAFALVPPR